MPNGIYKSNALVYPPVLPVTPAAPHQRDYMLTKSSDGRSRSVLPVSGCSALNLILTMTYTESMQLVGSARLSGTYKDRVLRRCKLNGQMISYLFIGSTLITY